MNNRPRSQGRKRFFPLVISGLLAVGVMVSDAQAWQTNGGWDPKFVPGNEDCQFKGGWGCQRWEKWCDPRCIPAEIINPALVKAVQHATPGLGRLGDVPNPGSPPDYYYRDMCITGASLAVGAFDEKSGVLKDETNGKGADDGSVFTEKYVGQVTGVKPVAGSCMPTIDTPKFTTPTTGNAAFAYYLQSDNAPFFAKGTADAAPSSPYGTSKFYGLATFFLGNAQGCPESVYRDIDLKTVNIKTAANWKKAAQRCYDYYIYSRAAHPEWTLERPGVSSDDPLTEKQPNRAIFNSCQPLVDGAETKKSSDAEKLSEKGFAKVLQYDRADLDEAEYDPAKYLKAGFSKEFPGLPVPAFQSALPCVEKKEAGAQVHKQWAAFNGLVTGSYMSIYIIESVFLNYHKGPTYHEPIADDFDYKSKGVGKPGFCPSVEKINMAAKEDIFAPRNDYKITDRDYSPETAHVTLKERMLMGFGMGYNGSVLGDMAEGLGSELTGALTGGSLAGVSGGLGAVGSGATGGLGSAVGGGLGGVTSAVGGATGGLTSAVGGGLGGVTSAVSGATGGLTSAVSGGLGGVTSAVGGVTSTVGSVTGAVGGITSTVGNVAGTVGSVTGVMAGATGAVDTVNGAVGGVKNITGMVTNTVPPIAGIPTTSIPGVSLPLPGSAPILTVGVPPVPGIPTIPSVSMPSLPATGLPAIPTVALPALPAVPGIANLPGVPSVPGLSGGLPGIPKIPGVADIPGVSNIPGVGNLPGGLPAVAGAAGDVMSALGKGTEPMVQCAIVPVDILESRRDAFDNCIMQRINYNYFSWRRNNFLDFYMLKDKKWKPPCSTRFYESDDASKCPVRMSIQQCCRIIVKDVVPVNDLKLRTCEGLRSKRMQALKYDHISENASPGGQVVAATDYKKALGMNQQLNQSKCDDTEPSEYAFRNHFKNFPPKADDLAAALPTALKPPSMDSLGKLIPGADTGDFKKMITNLPNLTDAQRAAAGTAMDKANAAISSLTTAYTNQYTASQKVTAYTNDVEAISKITNGLQSSIDAQEAEKKKCLESFMHRGCLGADESQKRELANMNRQLNAYQTELSKAQSIVDKADSQIASGQEVLSNAMGDVNKAIGQSTGKLAGEAGDIVSSAANLGGIAGGAFVGVHMPYMRWWDTGTSAGNAQHGGSFINTLGSFDVVVGVGREERTKEDAIAVGKKPDDIQPSHVGRIDGWEGLKGHQALTTRHFNLACIGRYERLFNSYGPENYVLTKAGAGFTSQQGFEIPWPLGWRGYVNDTHNGKAFPSVPFAPAGGTPSGLDNARKGDIVTFTMNGLKQLAFVFEDAVANPGSSSIDRVYIEFWDNGKFPVSTGASHAMGSLTQRTIYQKSVPESEQKRVCDLKLRALVGSACTPDMPSGHGKTDPCMINKCQPSCEDPDNTACVLPGDGWAQAKLYRATEDKNQKRLCSSKTNIAGFDFAKTYQAVPVGNSATVQKGDKSVVYQSRMSQVPTNTWSFCVNDGFDPPNIYRLGDYNGAGAGAKTDFTLCGPEWGGCSTSAKETKCFPGGVACNSAAEKPVLDIR